MNKTNRKFNLKKFVIKISNNIKKYWYIYTLIVLLIVSSIVVVSIINSKNENTIKQYIENKTFVQKYDDGNYYAYRFKEGNIAVEEGYGREYSDEDGYVSGDINDFSKKYKVKASVFTDEIWILTKYPHGYIRTVAVCIEDNIVKAYKHTSTTPDWEEVTLEELELTRVNTICKHKLKTVEILKESTCMQVGQEKTFCSKCNHIFTNEIPKKSHTYQNGECINCKSLARIQPNKWYKYQDGLEYSNCIIDFVTKIDMLNDRCTVKFYGVCEHCSKKSTNADAVVVYYGSSKNEYFRCKHCEKFTYAKFKYN